MWNKKNLLKCLMLAGLMLTFSSYTFADDEVAYEAATFTVTAPDVMILLDVTGTMHSLGPLYLYGSTSACTPDTANCTGTNCDGGFCATPITNCSTDCSANKAYMYSSNAACTPDYTNCGTKGFTNSSTTACSYNCSRVGIAKRALYEVINYNSDSQINNTDSSSLNVRLGAARFGASGYDLLKPVGETYQMVMCGSKNTTNICNPARVKTDTATSFNGSTTGCFEGKGECLSGAAKDSGGTALFSALESVKTEYEGWHDTAANCRQKFIILVTDGGETKKCGTADCINKVDLENRRQLVLEAKHIAESTHHDATATDAPKYKLIVIGLAAGMPEYYKNTLNWMGFWGNPANAGLNTATSTVAIKPMNLGTYNTCGTGDDATISGYCQVSSSGLMTTVTYFYAPSNDPGYVPLTGYAYMPTNMSELATALKEALAEISQGTYSFTQSSIQAVRTYVENYVYEASFNVATDDSLWIGHLKRYKICDSSRQTVGSTDCASSADWGKVYATADWDSGTVLKNRDITTYPRTIYTNTASGWTAFPSATSTTWDTLFGTSSATTPTTTQVINFIQGGDTAYASGATYYAWRLGDIFHSSPLSIATPNINFIDKIDQSNPKAFDTYRSNHVRTVDNGGRMLYVGANDGQLHAFKALDGTETWSFVPPNLLPKLKDIAHSSHPTTLTHRYFVDGPLSAAEIWSGSNQAAKTASEWKTLLVAALGRGGVTNLWSSSASCSSGFSADNKWSTSYPYYCGYYAFNVSTTSSAPTALAWHLTGSDTTNVGAMTAADGAAYIGQPWSKMYMGRVKIAGVETWVGLIGGGYSGSGCKTAATCDTRGKGFFVVRLSDGKILKSFVHTDSNGMDFDLVAGPSAVDYDGDGYIDRAYIGDLGGNIWRFKFCTAADDNTCGVSSWTGSMLLDNGTNNYNVNNEQNPIYNTPVLALGPDFKVWVYVGTGSKTDPTNITRTERFYAIRDADGSSTISESSLTNITSTNSTYDTPTSGWGWEWVFPSTDGPGQQVLADAVVYDQKVYFTTYVPKVNDVCSQAGDAYLYIVNYTSGAGLCGSGARSMAIGQGIPASPVVSINPDTGLYDVYVSTSVLSAASAGSHTQKVTDPSGTNSSANRLIYWRDKRVE